jgi:hypothetical protein
VCEKSRKFQGVFDSCKFCSSRQDFDVSKLKNLQGTHLGSASFSLLALLFAWSVFPLVHFFTCLAADMQMSKGNTLVSYSLLLFSILLLFCVSNFPSLAVKDHQFDRLLLTSFPLNRYSTRVVTIAFVNHFKKRANHSCKLFAFKEGKCSTEEWTCQKLGRDLLSHSIAGLFKGISYYWI